MQKQYFFFKESKELIDKIDEVLANYFGLSDQELDFVINYDIKYRVGRDADGDED